MSASLRKTSCFNFAIIKMATLAAFSYSSEMFGAVEPLPEDSISLDNFEARIFDDGKASTVDLRYRLFVPPQYQSSQSYPLVLVLHGLGQGGRDNESQLQDWPVVYELLNSASRARHPFFMVAPQSENQQFTGSPQREQLQSMIAELRDEFSIDPERIFVTGMSAGGNAAYMNAVEQSNLYAAYAAVAGFGPTNRTADIATLPAWFAHGSGDATVSVSSSRNLVNALRKAGGNILYTEYPGVGHTSWESFYKESAFIDWLLGQRKGVGNHASVSGPHLRILRAKQSETLSIEGIATGQNGNITTVSWANLASGLSGNAKGTEVWSVANIPLIIGENRIVVIASTSENLTFNDTILITHSGLESSDSAPTLSLESPLVGHDFATENNVILFKGSCEGANITNVQWSTDHGDTGMTDGTTNWSATLNLPEGVTIVTFRALDASGGQTCHEVRVEVNPDQPPTVFAGNYISLLLPDLSTNLSGTITDDFDSGHLSTTWRQVSGPAQSVMTNPYMISTRVSFTATGDYVFRLSATDLTHFVESDVQIAVSPPPPLVHWRYLYFGSSENSGLAANEADPDHDGAANLVEYYHGTNPMEYSSALPMKMELAELDGKSQFALRYRRAIKAEDVAVEIDRSYDLKNWKLVLPNSLEPIAGKDSQNQWLTLCAEAPGDELLPYTRLRYVTRDLPLTDARFLWRDEENRGSWKSVYGEEGYIIPRHRVVLPPYAQFSLTAGNAMQWAGQLSKPPAVQKATSETERLASNFNGEDGPLEMTLTINDRLPHRLTLYFLDWDSTARRQNIDIYDGESGVLLDQRILDESFHEGICFSWLIRGSIQIVITGIAGETPVVSAIFLDPVD